MNKKNYSKVGIAILLVVFLGFYLITSYFLELKHGSKSNMVNNINGNTVVVDNNQKYKDIVEGLYKDVRILYDVVNIKYKVSQDDTITIENIIYKKITNYDEVLGNLFTANGINKYMQELKSYFAYTESGYYIAGNLVSYQTYIFRGDSTNIYITSANDTVIDAIIYEKWTSNNTNTLATIKVIKQDNKWLIDDITILSQK